jgi:hypothetical protein
MSDSNTAALSEHGTLERWITDCDCFDCRWAVERKIHSSELVSTTGHLLGRMLEFRVRGCELYVVPTMIESQGQYSLGTIRRHLDALVNFGALTKAAPIEGYSGRSGIYILHFEKLTRRPILKMYDEFERLNETEGLTKATAWRVLMLREHETSNPNLCTRCENFSTEFGDRLRSLLRRHKRHSYQMSYMSRNNDSKSILRAKDAERLGASRNCKDEVFPTPATDVGEELTAETAKTWRVAQCHSLAIAQSRRVFTNKWHAVT